MIFKRKEKQDDGMEVIEKAAELVLLMALIGFGSMAKEVSDTVESGCEKVKDGVKSGCECVQEGYECVKDGVKGGFDAIKSGLEYINPFSLNNTLESAGKKVDEDIKDVPIGRLGKAMA